MFDMPCKRYSLENWEHTKGWINDVLKDYPLPDTPADKGAPREDFWETNQGHPGYMDDITSVVATSVSKFAKYVKIDIRNFFIYDMWHQVTDQFHCHMVHNHGATGFSACMYLNFVQGEHLPTRFYAPFPDAATGYSLDYMDLNTNEGDIVFFPSGILHESPINLSETPREIIAMNFRIDF
jgi:hypothetical protein|tara:strand:+ start:1222 stop:1764 length:543 start_codon:yes stop_codon:yes gene_type:complete